MNIHVVRPDGSWYSRPDITLVRDADRFCLPDDCTGACAVPARCFRIGKAGKAVEARFALRYLESWAESLLFYGQTAGGTLTPYLDCATWVSRDFRSLDLLDADECGRAIRCLGQVSRHVSLRIGDFLILETDSSVPLRRGDVCHNIAIL